MILFLHTTREHALTTQLSSLVCAMQCSAVQSFFHLLLLVFRIWVDPRRLVLQTDCGCDAMSIFRNLVSMSSTVFSLELCCCSVLSCPVLSDVAWVGSKARDLMSPRYNARTATNLINVCLFVGLFFHAFLLPPFFYPLPCSDSYSRSSLFFNFGHAVKLDTPNWLFAA